MSSKIIVLDVCRKELRILPESIKSEFLDALAKLEEGLNLSMPLSRPMPSVGKNAHELRFRDRAGIYRIFYVVKKSDSIFIVHAFTKKTQETPKKVIDLVKKRIKDLSL